MLDDRVAFPGRHGTRTQRVPGSLDVAFNCHGRGERYVSKRAHTFTQKTDDRLRLVSTKLTPLLNSLNILIRIIQILLQRLLARIQINRFSIRRLLDRHRPASMLQAGRKMFRPSIRLCRLEIQIPRARGRVVCEERVVARDFACIRSHAPACLAALDVTPYQRGHVSLVVHEACVEIGDFVGVGRGDVRRPARKGILQKLDMVLAYRPSTIEHETLRGIA